MQQFSPRHFLAVLFGPIGDALMALALCNDMLEIEPESEFVFITRRGAKMMRDLASSYPGITVLEIPGGWRALPFFARLLTKRWTLLTLGVTGVYSLRLKLFFLALGLLPGNRTIGFNDQPPGVTGWLPLQTIIQFDGRYTIDNFRRLLAYVFDEATAERLQGKPPYVRINGVLPAGFDLTPGSYIAINPFSASSLRSWPLRRWKELLAKIAAAFPEYRLVIIGGPKEEAAVLEIAGAVPGALALPNLPLLETAAVIDAAALYLGVDTGPTHLACVLQQKSLILSHYRFPAWLPTYNPNARALANSKRCECKTGGSCVVEEGGVPYSKCMYDISDAFVIDSLALALSSPARSVPNFGSFKDEYINGVTNHGYIPAVS